MMGVYRISRHRLLARQARAKSFIGENMGLNERTRIIGIASGKGGVGKTSIAANLAVSLVMRGHKVMLFDADLGLANAQLAFGCATRFNFGHVLRGEKSLQEIVVTTPQGVRLVPGASGIQQLASLGALETAGIVRAFSALDEEIDYFIVDAAAGISDSVITFMQATPLRFIVLRDEPSSIADAYGMIKVLVRQHGLENIHLLPNMVDSQAAGLALHRRVNDVCQRFLGVTVSYLHSITYDQHMLDAMRVYKPVIEFAPGGNAPRDFRQMAVATEQLRDPVDAGGGIQFFFDRLVARELQQ